MTCNLSSIISTYEGKYPSLFTKHAFTSSGAGGGGGGGSLITYPKTK